MKINGNPDGGGASAVIEGLSVTSNGTYTAGGGVDGYSPVEVNVPSPSFVTETLSVSVNGTYTPGQGVDGFSQVVVDVPQSVSGFTEKDLTEKTFTITNLNNSASYVASSAFYNTNTLQTVNLPNCKEVYSYAFQECANLSEISLPVCENIKDNAFNTTGLRTVYLPSCKNLGMMAFRYCRSLTEVNMPELIIVGGSTFQSCSSLVSVSIPKIKVIGGNMFMNCSLLSSVDISTCVIINQQAFQNTNITGRLDLANCISVSWQAFYNVKNITEISAPYLVSLGNNVFGGDASPYLNISVIDLPNVAYNGNGFYNVEGVTKINIPLYQSTWYAGFINMHDSGSAFTELSFGNKVYTVPSWSTGFSTMLNGLASNNGTIYVDAAMYDKWVSANGWSSYSSYFSIEGDSTVPMLSLSDGLLYGKTGAMYNYWWSNNWQGINVNSSAVTTVSLQECRVVYEAAFYSVRNIQSVYLPNCIYIGMSAFRECRSLTAIDLPKCRYIHDQAFAACSSLSSITLRESVVCWLNQANAFSYIESYSVYVPASLLDEYKSAPNWSNINYRIFPIE